MVTIWEGKTPMRRTIFFKRWILGAAAAAALLGSSGTAVPAYGLSLGGLGIRPANPRPPDTGWFVYQLKPGESVSDAVLVVNDTDAAVTVQLNAVDYEPTDIGAFGVKGSDAEQTDIGKWVQLATTTLDLPPRTSQEVPFTLAIPLDADVGEHAGAIMAQPTQARQSSKISGAYITTRVGARIYNTVPGELVHKLTLLGFSMHENMQTGHLEFTVRAKNDGNVSVSPSLKLHLDGWGLVQIPPPGDPELADFPGFAPFGFQRFLPKVLQNNWQLARDATVETYFRWRKPYLGRFTASLTMEYERTTGNPEVLQSETIRLTVLPWPETGYAIAILGGLISLLVAWIIWRKVHYSGRGWKTYVVAAGDTLTLIAAKSNVSWKRLAKVNRLKKPYVVSPGDKVRVPPGAKLATDGGSGKSTEKSTPRPETDRRGAPRAAMRKGWRWLPLAAILVASAIALGLGGLLLVRSVLRTPPPGTPPATAPITADQTAPATSTAPLPPAVATTTATSSPPLVAPAKDAVIIEVLNGSGIAGVAGEVVELFRQAGYRQLTAGNADRFDYQGVLIRFRTGQNGAAEDLQQVLRERYRKFTLEEVATSTVAADITVTLGSAGAP